MKSKTFLGLGGIALAVVVGCGGSGSGDDTQSGNGALSSGGVGAATADSPITLQNYVNHPKIKAVRDQVNEIDDDLAHGDLFTEDNPNACEATFTKVFGNHDVIFKIVANLGEGGGTTQAYYASRSAPFGLDGKLLFIVQVKGTQESRVYFDAQGNKFWQVVRQTGGADRLPQGNEVYQPDPLHSDPQKWFESGGC